MTDPEVGQLKSDIERTRAELAETVDALAAKLDVKAQARERMHAVADQAGQAMGRARSSAPVPVQHALDTVEQAARPVVAKAAADKKRAALVAGGLVVLLLVLRRARSHGRVRR
jgi:hypothetical protein